MGWVRGDCNGGPEGWGGSDRLGHSSHHIHPARFQPGLSPDRGRRFPAAPAPPRPHSSLKGSSAPPPLSPPGTGLFLCFLAWGAAASKQGWRPASAWSQMPCFHGPCPQSGFSPHNPGTCPPTPHPALAVASEQAELRGLVSPGAALRFSCPDPGQGRGRSQGGAISSQYGQDGGKEHRWRRWGPLARPHGQSQGCGALGLRGWLSPACGSPRR